MRITVGHDAECKFIGPEGCNVDEDHRSCNCKYGRRPGWCPLDRAGREGVTVALWYPAAMPAREAVPA